MRARTGTRAVLTGGRCDPELERAGKRGRKRVENRALGGVVARDDTDLVVERQRLLATVRVLRPPGQVCAVGVARQREVRPVARHPRRERLLGGRERMPEAENVGMPEQRLLEDVRGPELSEERVVLVGMRVQVPPDWGAAR